MSLILIAVGRVSDEAKRKLGIDVIYFLGFYYFKWWLYKKSGQLPASSLVFNGIGMNCLPLLLLHSKLLNRGLSESRDNKNEEALEKLFITTSHNNIDKKMVKSNRICEYNAFFKARIC